jgi:arginine utilization protein RocB
MSQPRLKEKVPHLKLILPESSDQSLGREGARGAESSPQNMEDLIPYSPKELKYLWTMWDEAKRHHQPGLRYRNIYAGAMGVILIGWLIYGMGLSLSAPLGGVLVLAGALIGGWYSLKSLRRQKQSGHRG